MKLLILAGYFYPETAGSLYLWDNIYEEFANEGYEMELHTPFPSRGVTTETRRNTKYVEELFNDKLKVIRFPMFREQNNTIIRAVRYFLCSLIQLYKGIKAKNINCIYVTSTPPTQGALAAILKKIKKVPFIYSLQDIFPDSLITTGITKKGSIVWKIGRIIEDFTYRNADKIIVISEDFKQNLIMKGVPENKIDIIYNWVDETAVFKVKREENKLFEKYGLNREKFFVTYCGNIGLTQNMDLLVEAADHLKTYNDIHFILVGDGAYKQQVLNEIRKRKLNNLTLLPFQPYEDIADVFSLGDVGLVISKKNVGQNSVPSKTWSILSAEKALLINFDEKSELYRLVEKFSIGLSTKIEDLESFTQGVLKLYNEKELCNQLGINGRTYILNNLSRRNGTKQYIEVFKSVLNFNT